MYWFVLEGDKKVGFKFYYIFIDEVYGDFFYLDEVELGIEFLFFIEIILYVFSLLYLVSKVSLD